jgi:hypothetical protein
MKTTALWLLVWVVGAWFAAVPGLVAAEAAKRLVPKPLATHPGNVFLAGEDVTLSLPAGGGGLWRLVNYEGELQAQVTVWEGQARLGKLPVGFYRLTRTNDANWISLAVLAPLKAPTPVTSPIGLDVAMAWFYRDERKMEAAASLCALAGVNWVRDRLNWAHMEPEPGRFAPANEYDASALIQSRAGLQILQVNHSSPRWANPKTKRFPPDLRQAWRFYQEMARRWQGKVAAFEPWNEADIPVFGGHPGSEMASLQKAACLGLKAGNPQVVACLNVFALHNPPQLDDLRQNEAWAYFDTYNFHHYEPFDNYSKIYSDHQTVSAGKPLWVTEAALPVKWAGDEGLKEPTEADLRVQAERVAKTYACALQEGAAVLFYFLLPHYVEGQTQFGLLRPDLTPRPAYVALAAVGRLLADAQPRGRYQAEDENVRALLFRAKPDGRSQDVLVMWSVKGPAAFTLPFLPTEAYDLMGRGLKPSREVSLSPAPLFVLLPPATAKTLPLLAPVAAAAPLKGEFSPVVLQATWPEEKLNLTKSAYRVAMDKEETIPVFIYNFSAQPRQGTLRLTPPPGCRASLPAAVELAPQERKELALVVECFRAAPGVIAPLKITGEFGKTDHPVLSLRLLPMR